MYKLNDLIYLWDENYLDFCLFLPVSLKHFWLLLRLDKKSCGEIDGWAMQEMVSKKVPRIALITMGNVVIPGFSSGLPAELIECLPTRLWRLDLGFTHHYSPPRTSTNYKFMSFCTSWILLINSLRLFLFLFELRQARRSFLSNFTTLRHYKFLIQKQAFQEFKKLGLV